MSEEKEGKKTGNALSAWLGKQVDGIKEGFRTRREAKKSDRLRLKERERNYRRLLKEERERRESEGAYLPDKDCFLELRHVNKVYDGFVQAVEDFNLQVHEHEFIVFVGPSGCGKSTTLRMIAGLEDITTGDLYIDGERANNRAPKDRNMAMVFQSYALYPHMNVYQNMAFSLKLRHEKREEIYERVKVAAKILELGDYLDRKPKELSGGQRQRVALGRAIVRNARVFLMDEPLSNLDAKLRVQMRASIVKLHNELKATTIYVTHDQTEAMTMATRIVVMKLGYIQQIGSPIEIYNNPANVFVATFIGSPAMNMVKARWEGDRVVLLDKDGRTFEVKTTEAVRKAHEDFYNGEIAAAKAKIKELSEENAAKRDPNVDAQVAKLEEDIAKFQAALGGSHDVIYGIRPEDIHEWSPEREERYGVNPYRVKVEVAAERRKAHEHYLHDEQQRRYYAQPEQNLFEHGQRLIPFNHNNSLYPSVRMACGFYVYFNISHILYKNYAL